MRIAFESEDDFTWKIYEMNADGSRQTNLTNNLADDLKPTWSPRRQIFDGEIISIINLSIVWAMLQ